VAVARLRLGTRGSALARAQAARVREALEAGNPGLVVETRIIRTSGDRLHQGPLAAVGGKGLFVKEIEEGLVAGTIDVAVHSMKDVPARLPEALMLAAVPPRADPRDVLVSAAPNVDALRSGATIGTASVRRRAQLLARRRDLDVVVLRGNVDTRLRRWRAGDFDAIVLAAAGLARLGVREPAATPIGIDVLLPAVGQGALALECRADDATTRGVLAALDDPPSSSAVSAERAFLAGIGGDCNTPLAAHATVAGDRLELRAEVFAVDGTRRIDGTEAGATADAARLGAALAARLLAQGAAELIGR
jgi:hydroxymethylbilane synthase